MKLLFWFGAVFFFLLFDSFILTGQPSYQFTYANYPYSVGDLDINENGEVSLIMFPKGGEGGAKEWYAGALDSSQKKITGTQFFPQRVHNLLLGQTFIKEESDWIFSAVYGIGGQTGGYFLGLDSSNDDLYCLSFVSASACNFSISGNKAFLFTDYRGSPREQGDIQVHEVEKETGVSKKKTGLRFKNLDYDRSGGIQPLGIKAVQNVDKDLILAGLTPKNGITQKSFIIKLDSLLCPKRGLILDDSLANFSEIITATDGSVYVVGRSKRPYPFETTGNTENAFILKFDSDLNLIWSKLIFADYFSFNNISCSLFPDNSLALVYSTRGAYPTILAHLNTEGEIISEKGYALFTPKVKVGKDGSLFMQTFTHFDADGRSFPKNIVAKTDALGEIENCETYSARLKTQPILLNFEPLESDTFSVANPVALGVDTRKFEVALTDFCELPEPPSPEFSLPDTVCSGDCIQALNLSNRNTQGRVWTLESDGFILTLKDSFDFSYCFQSPGLYTLRQTIWFLGANYSFEKQIEVVPPLVVEIQPDSVLCVLPPARVTINSNRDFDKIIWNSGSTDKEILVLESGVYAIRVSDKYCQATDSAALSFVYEKIDTQNIFPFHDSIKICQAHFPYNLKLESEVAPAFYDQNGKEYGDIFRIKKPGRLLFFTKILGCAFSKEVVVIEEVCSPKIFVPSVFSPNDDGINDEFLPLSQDIEPLGLAIYDRWGGKIFESSPIQIAWNGKVNSRKAQQGVYVFRFRYLNLLTGFEEQLSGDITVF